MAKEMSRRDFLRCVASMPILSETEGKGFDPVLMTYGLGILTSEIKQRQTVPGGTQFNLTDGGIVYTGLLNNGDSPSSLIGEMSRVPENCWNGFSLVTHDILRNVCMFFDGVGKQAFETVRDQMASGNKVFASLDDLMGSINYLPPYSPIAVGDSAVASGFNYGMRAGLMNSEKVVRANYAINQNGDKRVDTLCICVGGLGQNKLPSKATFAYKQVISGIDKTGTWARIK